MLPFDSRGLFSVMGHLLGWSCLFSLDNENPDEALPSAEDQAPQKKRVYPSSASNFSSLFRLLVGVLCFSVLAQRVRATNQPTQSPTLFAVNTTLNLVQNPGAEKGNVDWVGLTNDISTGWSAYNFIEDAHSGTYSFITEMTTNVSMSQNLSLTVGVTYSVTIWLLNAGAVSLKCGSDIAALSVDGGGYQSVSTNFVATNLIETLEVTGYTILGRFLAIDDISVTALQYPTSQPTSQPSFQPTIFLSGLLDDNVVAYYPCKGDVNDKSGNGNNGVAHSITYVADRHGNTNSACNFDGSAYIEVSNGAAFNFTNSFSISLWVKPGVQSASDATLIEKSHASATASGWTIQQGSVQNAYQYTYRQAIINEWATSGSTQLSFDEWSHLTIVKNNTALQSYLNGALVSTVYSASSTIKTNGGLSLFIGTSSPLYGYFFFIGSMDEIFILDSPLSAVQVAQLHNFESPTSQPSAQPSFQPSSQPSNQPTGEPSSQPTRQPTTFLLNALSSNRVAEYLFNNNLNDTSGNDNHGAGHSVELVADRFGNPLSACNLNGFSSYIEIPGDSFNFIDELTISVWIKLFANSYTNGCVELLSKSHSPGGLVIESCASSNDFFFGYYTAENSFFPLDIVLTEDSWSHLVFTKKGTTVSLYVNGSVVDSATTAVASILSNNNLPLIIGAWNSGHTQPASGVTRFLNATVDDISFYNSTLSEWEVMGLYSTLAMYPSSRPSSRPSRAPSVRPSTWPTNHPTAFPSTKPSSDPSIVPSEQPVVAPSSQPTSQPTLFPSAQPSRMPTKRPTGLPTRRPYAAPSSKPSKNPTSKPSRKPSNQPTNRPTRQPSRKPTTQPTRGPSRLPSSAPSVVPTVYPSKQPIVRPTSWPTGQPTLVPVLIPTLIPTIHPTTGKPTLMPTWILTFIPTIFPSTMPTIFPSIIPTMFPSMSPTLVPTFVLTVSPSGQPTWMPTWVMTWMPTVFPSTVPTFIPSIFPTMFPSMFPTLVPTLVPSTLVPTTIKPSTVIPTTVYPTFGPTVIPTVIPSVIPTFIPTPIPTVIPSVLPTLLPSALPTSAPIFVLDYWASYNQALYGKEVFTRFENIDDRMISFSNNAYWEFYLDGSFAYSQFLPCSVTSFALINTSTIIYTCMQNNLFSLFALNRFLHKFFPFSDVTLPQVNFLIFEPLTNTLYVVGADDNQQLTILKTDMDEAVFSGNTFTMPGYRLTIRTGVSIGNVTGLTGIIVAGDAVRSTQQEMAMLSFDADLNVRAVRIFGMFTVLQQAIYTIKMLPCEPGFYGCGNVIIGGMVAGRAFINYIYSIYLLVVGRGFRASGSSVFTNIVSINDDYFAMGTINGEVIAVSANTVNGFFGVSITLPENKSAIRCILSTFNTTLTPLFLAVCLTNTNESVSLIANETLGVLRLPQGYTVSQATFAYDMAFAGQSASLSVVVWTQTRTPTILPTQLPTVALTKIPTKIPTVKPSKVPFVAPSLMPLLLGAPTELPVIIVTETPSEDPSEKPSEKPSEEPSEVPTEGPTMEPSEGATEYSTFVSSDFLSEVPSASPSVTPSNAPTIVPMQIQNSLTRKPFSIPTVSPVSSPQVKMETIDCTGDSGVSCVVNNPISPMTCNVNATHIFFNYFNNTANVTVIDWLNSVLNGTLAIDTSANATCSIKEEEVDIKKKDKQLSSATLAGLIVGLLVFCFFIALSATEEGRAILNSFFKYKLFAEEVKDFYFPYVIEEGRDEEEGVSNLAGDGRISIVLENHSDEELSDLTDEKELSDLTDKNEVQEEIRSVSSIGFFGRDSEASLSSKSSAEEDISTILSVQNLFSGSAEEDTRTTSSAQNLI